MISSRIFFDVRDRNYSRAFFYALIADSYQFFKKFYSVERQGELFITEYYFSFIETLQSIASEKECIRVDI